MTKILEDFEEMPTRTTKATATVTAHPSRVRDLRVRPATLSAVATQFTSLRGTFFFSFSSDGGDVEE